MNETDNQQKRLMDIGWLAGTLESEGCFSLQKTNNRGKITYSPLVQITNTNPLIIMKSARIIKDLGLACYVYLQGKKDHKFCYRVVTLGVKRVKRFLDVMAPYIECRSEQAACLHRFVDSKLSHERASELTNIEQDALDNLQRLNRPYLFPETARMPQALAEMLQSNLSEDTKAAIAAA